jgi:hypothetical protein
VYYWLLKSYLAALRFLAEIFLSEQVSPAVMLHTFYSVLKGLIVGLRVTIKLSWFFSRSQVELKGSALK